MSPRAVSAKGDPVFIHAQFIRILPDQICTSFRIVMCGGEGMLGCESVLNRNDPTVTVKRQLAKLIIMGFKPTADKTTAMIVEGTR
ncbi:hypothetical protein KAM546c_43680 [Enterobacter roggenkampii]|nr:hypothetical protein KAM546c_43680 [Enterobacter roggenkampii]